MSPGGKGAQPAVWIARGSKAKTGEELAQEPSSTSKAICGKQTAQYSFVSVNIEKKGCAEYLDLNP